MDAREKEILDAVRNALKVLIWDWNTRAYLDANDPKALEQAEKAIAQSDVSLWFQTPADLGMGGIASEARTNAFNAYAIARKEAVEVKKAIDEKVLLAKALYERAVDADNLPTGTPSVAAQAYK